MCPTEKAEPSAAQTHPACPHTCVPTCPPRGPPFPSMTSDCGPHLPSAVRSCVPAPGTQQPASG
eukprot:15444663-Alexandrium_andersonii.AAC.1